MEILDLKDEELKRVVELYNYFKIVNPWWSDSLDYIREKLSRCEKCGVINENEYFSKVWSSQDQKEYNCCAKCKQLIESDNLVNSPEEARQDI